MSEYASERVNKLLDERDALRTRVAELEAALTKAIPLLIRCGCDQQYPAFVEIKAALVQEGGK